MIRGQSPLLRASAPRLQYPGGVVETRQSKRHRFFIRFPSRKTERFQSARFVSVGSQKIVRGRADGQMGGCRSRIRTVCRVESGMGKIRWNCSDRVVPTSRPVSAFDSPKLFLPGCHRFHACAFILSLDTIAPMSQPNNPFFPNCAALKKQRWFRVPGLLLLLLAGLSVAPPASAQTTNKQAQIEALNSEMNDAMEQVRKIVNQPVTRYVRQSGLDMACSTPAGFTPAPIPRTSTTWMSAPRRKRLRQVRLRQLGPEPGRDVSWPGIGI